MMIPRLMAMLCATLAAASVAYAHPAHDALPQLDFQPPAPGSYQLHRIMPAPDGQVLNVDGKAQSLSRLTGDKITLLGFIYTSCADPEGCPRAYRVFDDLKKQILAIPALNDKVRFVTLSFDPERDTPKVMEQYGSGRLLNAKGLDWYFLTTRSTAEAMPLIDGFGQDVRYSFSKANGKLNRELSHVLKVFLIDRDRNIREIYTSTFLHPQTVMADVKTLLMELGEKTD
jgi:protein SCO1